MEDRTIEVDGDSDTLIRIYSMKQFQLLQDRSFRSIPALQLSPPLSKPC